MKGKTLPHFKNVHLAARILAIFFLFLASLGLQPSFPGIPLTPMIIWGILGVYLLVDLILILRFSHYTFEEPSLIFLDFALGLMLSLFYQGNLFFSLPFFLAVFTAASLSFGGAVGMAFIGAGLSFAVQAYIHHFDFSALFKEPLWFFILVTGFLLSAMGIFKNENILKDKKMDSLVSLLEVGQQLGSTLTYEHIFNTAFSVAKTLFASTSCAIYLKDTEGIMRLKGIESPYPKLFRDFDPKVVKSHVTEVVNEKKPIFITDVEILPESEDQVLPKARLLHAAMIAPLVSEGETIGLLFASGGTPGMYDEESLKLFTVLANQITISVRNVQLHEKTTTMAITDSVSGLYTHGYMQEALEREFRRCKYANLPLSTIILDVDHFKIINDTYGHPQGDALLRQLGSVIKTVTRNTDIVCRYGGDEFMVILPETNRIGAVLVAERIRQTVEEYEFVLGSKIVHITISGGVASFPEDIQTKKELIEKTDQALYRSKQGGRNKVSFGA